VIDLCEMFESNNFNTDLYPEERDPLDFAQAVGLAEAMMDARDVNYEDVESLFDDDERTHEKAELISLKTRHNKRNVPPFERMVMKKCGLL